MMQMVIGAAVGCLIAQGVLYAARLVAGRLQFNPVRTRMRTLSSAAGLTIIGGLVRYAGVLGVIAALVTLGFWGVGDYRAARSARSAEAADTFDIPQRPPPPAAARGPHDELAHAAPAADIHAAAAPASGPHDPYADPDFRVRPRPHRPGSGARVEETLLRRSEAKARSELLSETRLHADRSQYDCEASDRAARYLKAGLDVWGFAAWQSKYFPAASYRGATLPACKDIKQVVDPARAQWQSTVAQQDQR
ncbi:MAG TPA: hypothetical protein VFK87_07575 [Steroidobacteraceae bacterium]|nr:hypothetical protein [Steroidobacteraceae bacterium]